MSPEQHTLPVSKLSLNSNPLLSMKHTRIQSVVSHAMMASSPEQFNSIVGGHTSNGPVVLMPKITST